MCCASDRAGAGRDNRDPTSQQNQTNWTTSQTRARSGGANVWAECSYAINDVLCATSLRAIGWHVPSFRQLLSTTRSSQGRTNSDSLLPLALHYKCGPVVWRFPTFGSPHGDLSRPECSRRPLVMDQHCLIEWLH